MFDFDKPLNRFNTNSLKWDCNEKELPMWVADMDFEVAPAIKNAILNKLNQGALGYSVIPDSLYESYINFWNDRHHVKFEKEWLIFSIGVVASISSIIRKLTTIAENVLLMAPVYNIFYNSIYNNGRNITSSDLIYENGTYHIDFNDLEKKLANPQTTLMILCNPHNPTGNIWTKEELVKIGSLAKKYNVIVLSDEIHCDMVAPGYEYIPFSSVNEECKMNSISTIAPSKTFNIAGLQSSMIVVPNPLLRQKVNRGLNTDECAEPNIFAIDATIAAFNDSREWLNEVNIYLNDNKKMFIDYINKNIPLLYAIPSHATYLLWVDCSKVTNDTEDLCNFIREKTGLWITAGKAYGENGKQFVRINLATQKVNIKDGMNRLKKGIELYIKK